MPIQCTGIATALQLTALLMRVPTSNDAALTRVRLPSDGPHGHTCTATPDPRSAFCHGCSALLDWAVLATDEEVAA